MLNFNILGICQVINLEELFHSFYTLGSQINNFVLFVNNEITGFFLFYPHDNIHFAQIRHILTTLHLLGKNITYLIKLGGFTALTGNDKGCSGFIDQYGVHLIDDSKMQVTQYQLGFVNDHVITQIVKSQLVIGDVSNITIICFPSFF